MEMEINVKQEMRVRQKKASNDDIVIDLLEHLSYVVDGAQKPSTPRLQLYRIFIVFI